MNALDENIPNGGYGWVIVAAVAIVNMCNQSITSVFGLLFGEQLHSMDQGTSAAAFLSNFNSLVLNFSGLFIGPAIKNFSVRWVAAAGCVITSCGLVLCSQATEVWHFAIGYSFLVGIGLGLLAPSTFLAINSYFSTKKGRAVGLSLAGTGVGQMITPHIVTRLLENYGFRTTIFVMGMFALVGLFGAALFRPLPPRPAIRNDEVKEIKVLLENKEHQAKTFEVKISEMGTQTEPQKPESKTKKLCSKICHSLVQAMDLELLKDPIFWSIILGMGLVYTATMNFSMLFPYFLQHSAGLTRSDTAMCMSIVAGADIVSRLLLPHATDKLHVPYRVVFLLGTFGLLISRAALAETHDLTNLIVLSAFTGITKSATVLNNNLVIQAHCKKEKLPGGVGLNMLSKGVLVITIGQLLGFIRDYSGSYIICLHSQNFLLGLVIAVWSAELIYKYFKMRKVKESGKSVTNIEC